MTNRDSPDDRNAGGNDRCGGKRTSLAPVADDSYAPEAALQLHRPSCRASRDAVTALAEASSDLIIGLGANSRDWTIPYLGQLAAALPMPARAPEEIC